MSLETIRDGRTILVGSTEGEVETGQPSGKVLVDQRLLNNVWFVGRSPRGLHFQRTNTLQYWVVPTDKGWAVQDDEEAEIFHSSSLTDIVEWINRQAANPHAGAERGRRTPRPGFHPATVDERRALGIPAFYVDVFAADHMDSDVAAYGFDAFDTRHDFAPEGRG